MKLIPLNDKVLILPVSPESKSPGGIIIPSTAEGKPTRGTVIALGLKVYEKLGYACGDPLFSIEAQNAVLKIGSEVMFSSYGGIEVDIEGVKHRLLPVEELLGVINHD